MKKHTIYNWDKLPVILDIKTVALICNVNVNTVKQWLYKDQIKGCKIGKKWMFSKEYIQALVSVADD